LCATCRAQQDRSEKQSAYLFHDLAPVLWRRE
jgi:hypothetical protein